MTENHKQVRIVIVTGQCVNMSHAQASAASYLHLHRRALLGAGGGGGGAVPLRHPPFLTLLCVFLTLHKTSTRVWSHRSFADL